MDRLDISILAPAFVAGLMVLITHVPLGREVIKRGIIFIDLAIAQIAGLGVIIASYVGWETHGVAVQLVAVGSALTGAFLLSTAERFFGQYQEAAIGVTFVLAATAGIILLANNPRGGEHLQELLVGQILWVEWQQLVMPALIACVILVFWFAKPQLFQRRSFYLFFAVAVTSSVQLVGIYLVFSSLIVPALTTIKVTSNQRAFWLAYVLGVAGYGLGLLCSALFDLPSGAVIVWAMCLLAALASLCLIIQKR